MSSTHPLWRCFALYKQMPWRFAATAFLFIVLNAGLTTIRNGDRIAAVLDGTLAEIGTHTSLLAQGGTYSRLYQAYEDSGVPAQPLAARHSEQDFVSAK